MFTGLVEATGEVVALERSAHGARLGIKVPAVINDLALGDSLAVNGCCLTVTHRTADVLHFDLLTETLNRTNLGDLAPAMPVNLERALAAHARLGGHFVQGHVDVAAELLALDPAGADHRLEVELPPRFAGYVVEKGSVCLDGISLTIAEVRAKSIIVWIIPHTLAVTNLRTRRAGDRLNVEFDLLAKYVERILQVNPAYGSAKAT